MDVKKLFSLFLAVMLVCASGQTNVLAAEVDEDTAARSASIVEIASSNDLVEAIKNQQDGQTWVFTQAGTYDAATPDEDGNNGGYDLPEGVEMPYPDGQMASHPGPYAFPIYAENLTIKKADGVSGKVVLTTSATPTFNDNEVSGVNGGGNWNWQSFMIVSGSGVTIEGVSLQGNENKFNVNGNAGGLVGGQCDKIIETVDSAGDLTLRNVVIEPMTVEGETGNYAKYNGTQRSGSLYFSHAYSADKTVTLENVRTYGGIKSAKNVKIVLDGVVSDFTNNTYSSYDQNTANYAWNPGIRGGSAGELSNASVGENGFTLIMDDEVDSRQVFNESLLDGMTVQLKPGDYNLQRNNTYSVQGQTGWYMPITKSITVQGVDEAGNVIGDAAQTRANLYSTEYTANGSLSTQNLITVFADDVVLEGLTVMNKIAPNKAIEVVGSENPMDFTVRNCKFAPIREDLLTAETEQYYTYEDYKEYGASLYFTAQGKHEINAKIENNLFEHSTITFGAPTKGSYTVTGNTFEGAKSLKETQYSTIGYQGKWLYPDPDCHTLGEAEILVTGNVFDNAGAVNFSQVTEGDSYVEFEGNTGLDASQVSGPVKVDDNVTIDTEEELKYAVGAAKDGEVLAISSDITLADGLFIDKDITLEGNGYTITFSELKTSSDAVNGESTPYTAIITAKDADVVLKDLKVKGDIAVASANSALTHSTRYAGIAAINANLTLDGCTVSDITYEGQLQGMQNGFGIYAVTEAGEKELTLVDTVIENFNKTAIIAREGIKLNIEGSRITGFGPQGVIAQNGIQFTSSAVIKDTIIENLVYNAENEWKYCSTALYHIASENDPAEILLENVTIKNTDISYQTNGGKTVIKGGYFSRSGDNPSIIAENAQLLISGGQFEGMDEEFFEDSVEDGYVVQEQEDGTIVVVVDKSALKALIEKYEALKLEKADYTEATFTAYESALKNAKAVLADENATKEDVANAKAALEKAYAALEKVTAGQDDKETGEEQSGVPETGDNSGILLWGALALMAAIALSGAVMYNRKRTHCE